MFSYIITLIIVTVFFSSNIWRFIDEPASAGKHRVTAIDGMRGYLALSVMLHHAVIARTWLSTGRWSLPEDWLFSQLGSVAVALFFMITGYLFWGKLLARDGRVDWLRLYIGRFFRIAPIYWIAITGLVIVVFARSGFQLQDSPTDVAKALAQWYALGFLVQHDFNGYENVWIIVAGVVWTLKYEWRFYIALLPASLFARPRLHLIAAFAFLLLSIAGAQLSHAESWKYLTMFAIGMLTASLAKAEIRIPLARNLSSAIALIALGAACWVHPEPFSTLQALLLGIMFFQVANGADIFGLLSSRAAVRLGHISYGIYLLHGFVFSIGFDNAAIRPIVMRGSIEFWIVTIVGALVLSAIAALLHASVERPFIDLGHRVGKRASAGVGRWMAAKGNAGNERLGDGTTG
ncbi:acyltransferase family protein [Burkholderia ubonensis]|uniref:Acyltransferase 3 domain-containing protein n=1 Tax=Burkholderia ubonensis subsp. mesacidophila TaxID=265293 RepID=A0A2A4FLP3_9BURK|nr:acyltransferase [Burkholderia ubonensis]PCE33336.1 hypothetical protein BZL54_05860 [Burkholderia ubonensis subsp. mesacidophila]